MMETIAAMAARKLSNLLVEDFRETFGPRHDETAENLGALARSAIECIGRSDALYHNFEHTMQVTIVGREILRGRMLGERIEPEDYSHLIAACLLHDIGFVRGTPQRRQQDRVCCGSKREDSDASSRGLGRVPHRVSC